MQTKGVIVRSENSPIISTGRQRRGVGLALSRQPTLTRRIRLAKLGVVSATRARRIQAPLAFLCRWAYSSYSVLLMNFALKVGLRSHTGHQKAISARSQGAGALELDRSTRRTGEVMQFAGDS